MSAARDEADRVDRILLSWREAMDRGGLAGCVLNGAKEVALEAFMAGRIGFLDMAAVVEKVLAELTGARHTDVEFSLDNVRHVDHLAREAAGALPGSYRL